MGALNALSLPLMVGWAAWLVVGAILMVWARRVRAMSEMVRVMPRAVSRPPASRPRTAVRPPAPAASAPWQRRLR